MLIAAFQIFSQKISKTRTFYTDIHVPSRTNYHLEEFLLRHAFLFAKMRCRWYNDGGKTNYHEGDHP